MKHLSEKIKAITKAKSDRIEAKEIGKNAEKKIGKKENAEKKIGKKENAETKTFTKSPPIKKDLVDEAAFKGSKNIETNEKELLRKRNINGTVSVVFPKIDLSPKGNGTGKRFSN